MRNQIVILAAGKGTRMGGNVPKVLVMLKNKPLILHLLEQVDKINQLAKPVIVVGYMADKVKAVLGEGYIYAEQRQQLGTADAIKVALKKVTGQNILVLYGDHPFIQAESLKKLMTVHDKKQAKLSVFTVTVPNFNGVYKPLESFGRIVRDASKKISRVVEYRDASTGQKKIKELISGIYMFKTDWLKKNISKIKNKNSQGEYYLTDIVSIAIADSQDVENLPIEPKEVLGINNKEDLYLAEKLISN